MFFTSPQQLFFVLKIFKFLPWLFGHKEKWLYQKDKVNFKIYDVTVWLTTIAIYVLPNISRSNYNQTMTFGQLTEYNMIGNFLEKSYTKWCGDISPRLFLKNQNCAYLCISGQTFYTAIFYCLTNWRLSKYILKLSCKPLAIASYKAFKGTKDDWNYSPFLIFCMIF